MATTAASLGGVSRQTCVRPPGTYAAELSDLFALKPLQMFGYGGKDDF